MAVSTCKKIREILSTEASGWFPNVESHGFSLFEENVTTGHTGRSMSARRLPQPGMAFVMSRSDLGRTTRMATIPFRAEI